MNTRILAKGISILTILALIITMFAVIEPTYAVTKKIHLKKTSVTVTYGSTYQQKLINKSGKTIKATSVTWKSKDKSIAKINKYGKVTTVKAGTTKMTAKYKGKTYTFTVKVKNPKLRATKKTLKCGATYTQKLYYANGNAIKASNIKFTTSNSKVATVSSKGVIKAKTAGTTTITAKYKGKTFKSTVKVKHIEVIEEGVEASCTSIGVTEGKYCAVCEKVITKQKIVPAKGHKEVIDEARDATFNETGLTEGKHCSVCNAVLMAQQIIPKLSPSDNSTIEIKKNDILKTYDSLYDYNEYSIDYVEVEKKDTSGSKFQITVTITAIMLLEPEDVEYVPDYIKGYWNLKKDGESVDWGTFTISDVEELEYREASFTCKDLEPGEYTLHFTSYI